MCKPDVGLKIKQFKKYWEHQRCGQIVVVIEYWTKLVECNALQVAVHFENCTALLRIAVHLLPKM